jgi:oxidoreductase
MQAVVIGATGACGKYLVSSLLQSKDGVAKVTLLSRRRLEEVAGVDVAAEESAGRLCQHVEDLDSVSDDTVRQLCGGAHVFFNTLGTSRRAAGSAAAYRHIDLEIPERLSRLAQEAGVKHCSVVTSSGSNPNSWFLYLRTKGELENAVRGMGFSHVSLFRPGGLNRGDSMRTVEKIAALVIPTLSVELVGQALAQDAITYHTSTGDQQQNDREMIANNSAIRRLAQQFQQKVSPPPAAATTTTETPPQQPAPEVEKD